ncbi:protein required for normal CLN1 and CLN2 G1 cyclin expression [Terramyces sp. JEL0728]|nr:protein required for normal CLN1 and CLN2 G1 cyclin expression [Terramyces sp. JEL0728]
MNKIEILLNDQLLEVDLGDLKGNDGPLIEILNQNPQNHKLFFEYHKRGMKQEFERFLLAGKKQAQANSLKVDETLLAADSNQKRKDVDLLIQAAQLLNESEQISRSDKFTLVAKANLICSRIKKGLTKHDRDLDQALSSYKQALSFDANFVPALIGIASAYFKKEDYKAALNYYQRVLSHLPDINPDVRVPIGLCFYKLSMYTEARLAFERAVEINPSNSNAKLFLAIMDINESKNESIAPAEKKRLEKRSQQGLAEVYKLNPRNGLVLSQLAEVYLKKKDFHKAKIMAASAPLYTKSNEILAEALAIKGRICQCEVTLILTQNDYENSFKHFEEAVKLNPNALVNQYSLAQMYIYKGDTDNAIKCLETILAKDANDYDTLKMIFSLNSSSGKTEKAQQYLESFQKMIRAVQDEDFVLNDIELLCDIAEFYEQTDIINSRNKYLEMLKLMESQESAVCPELLNNIAVLFHLEADAINEYFDTSSKKFSKLAFSESTDDHFRMLLDEAKSLYERALIVLLDENYKANEELEKLDALQTSIRINVARLYESQGDIGSAEAQYQELLRMHPSYDDCLLSLGRIEDMKGNDDAALDYYSQALAISKENYMAWYMIGNHHLKRKRYRAARKSFEKVLEVKRYDTYALCSAGNLCLIFARGDPNQQNRLLHFSRSIEYFCKVLSLEPSNVHAAYGIAVAYAEIGKFIESRDVFNQIQELGSSDSLMMLNAAHVLIENGQVNAGITLYEGIYKKSGIRNDIHTLKSLSRAYYILAKNSKDVAAMKTALTYIKKAIHLAPWDKSLFFNMALIEQQYVNVLNDQPMENRSIDVMRESAKDLGIAEKVFHFLGSIKGENLGYDAPKARERAVYCKGVGKISEKKIHETEVLFRQKHERLQEIKEKQLRQEQEDRLRKQQEKERERREQEELEIKRREINERMQVENEKMREEKKRKEESDGEEQPKKPRKKKRKEATDDEDEEPQKARGKKSKTVITDSDDE